MKAEGVMTNMRRARNVGSFQFPAPAQLTFAFGRSQCLKCYGREVIRRESLWETWLIVSINTSV